MKIKFVYNWIITCVVMAFTLASCDDDEQKIPFGKLPEVSQQFIETHFSGVAVTKVEKESGEPHYKVYLANGFEVRFFKAGDWQDVDGGDAPIPYTMQIELLPMKIVNYVSENFPAAEMIEMSRHSFGYEIELNTTPETEIRFDKDGNIIVSVIE